MRRVVITGLGAVTPIGNTVPETWENVKAGKCGIAPITHFDTTDRKVKVAGEVKNLDIESFIDKKELRKMKRAGFNLRSRLSSAKRHVLFGPHFHIFLN